MNTFILGTDNVMVWLPTRNGTFSTKSFYSSLTYRRVELFLMAQYGILRCHQELPSLLGKQHGPKF